MCGAACLNGSLNPKDIVYRPLHGLLLGAPWHVGRVVLVGDAVHATTPHLASGAGLVVEAAIVLAQELARCHRLQGNEGPLPSSLTPSGGGRRISSAQGLIEGALVAYVGRRYDRSRLTVNSSLRLGEIEQTSGSREEHVQIMVHGMQALRAPI